MRRSLAIFVLLVTACSAVAPAFAAVIVGTPACCRRDGKHHCQGAMSGMGDMASDRAPQLRALAPACPRCAPIATSVSSGQPEAPGFSVPALPTATLVTVANHLGFASLPVLRNSERGPPSSL